MIHWVSKTCWCQYQENLASLEGTCSFHSKRKMTSDWFIRAILIHRNYFSFHERIQSANKLTLLSRKLTFSLTGKILVWLGSDKINIVFTVIVFNFFSVEKEEKQVDCLIRLIYQSYTFCQTSVSILCTYTFFGFFELMNFGIQGKLTLILIDKKIIGCLN